MNFDHLLDKKEQEIERKYGSWMDRGSSSGRSGSKGSRKGGNTGKNLKKLAEQRDNERMVSFT